MIKLETFSDDELKAELERRLEVGDGVRDEPPRQLLVKDFQPVTDICVRYIEELAKGDEGRTKDFAHYIYEVAIETVYGKDVWDWINKRHG